MENKTVEELKVIAFDLDMNIKASQQKYNQVIQLLGQKLQEKETKKK